MNPEPLIRREEGVDCESEIPDPFITGNLIDNACNTK